MMQNHLNKVLTSLRQKAHVKSGEIGQVVLEKRFKYFMVLYLYIAQEQGQITHPRDSGGGVRGMQNLILTKPFYYFYNTL